jgi:hypothetical protein
LKINGAELLKATDDGAFMQVLKDFFASLDEPIYPDAESVKARSLTVRQSFIFQNTTSNGFNA